jgi:hypothetical protein
MAGPGRRYHEAGDDHRHRRCEKAGKSRITLKRGLSATPIAKQSIFAQWSGQAAGTVSALTDASDGGSFIWPRELEEGRVKVRITACKMFGHVIAPWETSRT